MSVLIVFINYLIHFEIESNMDLRETQPKQQAASRRFDHQLLPVQINTQKLTLNTQVNKIQTSLFTTPSSFSSLSRGNSIYNPAVSVTKVN